MAKETLSEELALEPELELAEPDDAVNHDCETFRQWWEEWGKEQESTPIEMAEMAWDAAKHLRESQAGFVGPALKPANLVMPDDPIKIGRMAKKPRSHSVGTGWNWEEKDDERQRAQQRRIVASRNENRTVYKPPPPLINHAPVVYDSVSDRFVLWIQDYKTHIFWVTGFIVVAAGYVLVIRAQGM